MRSALKAQVGRRGVFRAIFVRYGSYQPYKGPPVVTLLFSGVTDGKGQQVTDHLWFRGCKAWRAFTFHVGDQVQFTATVKPYRKGYRGRRDDDELPGPSTDYKLAWPGDVRLLEPPKAQGGPEQLRLI